MTEVVHDMTTSNQDADARILDIAITRDEKTDAMQRVATLANIMSSAAGPEAAVKNLILGIEASANALVQFVEPDSIEMLMTKLGQNAAGFGRYYARAKASGLSPREFAAQEQAAKAEQADAPKSPSVFVPGNGTVN